MAWRYELSLSERSPYALITSMDGQADLEDGETVLLGIYDNFEDEGTLTEHATVEAAIELARSEVRSKFEAGPEGR